ncbi:Ankyrin repeat and SOCS box protein 13 [Armadillidium vulgare]|nr:Ankyrin repeat and SOCS box protein 13 [Armadillidium vulgare]
MEDIAREGPVTLAQQLLMEKKLNRCYTDGKAAAEERQLRQYGHTKYCPEATTYMDTDSHCNTFPLHEAVVSGYFETVKSLIENGYCVNTMHYDRVTPLHMACLKGNIQIVCYLIKKGAWVNVQSIDNSTPLCDASAGGNIECVKILLEAGAWVNPPLLLSTPLHEASLRGRSSIIIIT